MRIFFLIAFCIFLTQPTNSQSINDAEVVFNNKQYTKAKSMYESLLKRKPMDALLNYKYARCCFELKEFGLAVKHFELSGTKYPLRDAYLAEAYFQNYQFDKSTEACQQYLATLDSTDIKFTHYQQFMKKANLGSRLINRVEDIAITDSSVVNKTEFLKSYNFNAELGSLTQQRIKTGKVVQDKITFKTQRADRSCFSDSTKGNMDLFSSYKLLDEWTTPVSLSKTINTSANENYPFLLPDGITLYYASDGENSLGGYDIFLTKYAASSKDYLTPENAGFPFNSTANDYMMVIDEHQKTGWFATDRNQPNGKVIVYSFSFSDPKRYFKSEDSVKVRNVALLKTYKRSKAKPGVSTSKKTEKTEILQLSNRIVINDSIVYTEPTQFQSQKAMQLYNESVLMAAELNTIEKSLNEARNKYENAAIDERKGFEFEIKTLESKSLTLKNEVANKKKQAINDEIKFLFKY